MHACIGLESHCIIDKHKHSTRKKISPAPPSHSTHSFSLPLPILAIGGVMDLFGSRAGALFDRYAATEAAANIVITAVFNPNRAQRIATQRSLSISVNESESQSLPSLFEVMRSFSNRVILSQHDNNNKGHVAANDNDNERGVSEINSRGVGSNEWGVELEVGVGRGVRSFSSRTSGSDLSAVSKEGEFDLEVFVIQSVLVNAYLLLLNNPSSSFLVKSQVAAHLRELNAAITKILNEMTGSEPFQTDEKEAHYRLLSSSISAGKPFLALLPTPLGPPI